MNVPLTEIPEYNGFKPGQMVRIKGENESIYVIKKIVVNPRTNAMWADLFGGRKGRGPQARGRTASFRSISLDRLTPAK